MSVEQLSIFDLLNNEEALPRNIKLLSLFSGIGAFEKALYNLGISYELINYCEIDKYASRSYSAIHGVSENMNLWDVTKIRERDLPKDIDLLTYGFPCQDISLAGKQKGLFNDDGTKTRSGLFFDALRCIEAAQPRVAIAENVKNLTGKKFNAQFQVVLASLEAAGYNNYWAVLNLRYFGIPQNRERVFIVSIRKDLDKGLFEFAKGFPLEKRLKDVLEETVDEKYYLQDKVLAYCIKHEGVRTQILNRDSETTGCAITAVGNANWTGNFIEEPAVKVVGRINSSQDDVVVSVDGIAPTHTAGHGNTPKILEEPAIIQVGQIYPNSGNPQAGRIYDANGISPTMDTCSGGNRMPKVVEPIVYDGYNQRIRADQSCVGTITQNVGKNLKRNGQGIIELVVLQLPRGKNKGGIKEISPTLTSNAWEQNNFCAEKQIQGSLRIRKLTPKECFRLMGFDDKDFEKAKWFSKAESAELLKQYPKHKGKRQFTEEGRIEKMSDTQLYKQTGNSIGVPVIEYIIKQLLKCEIWE